MQRRPGRGRPWHPWRRRATRGVAVLAALLLVGCGHAPPAPPIEHLFHDAGFAAPARPVQPERVLALSPSMRDYADHALTGGVWRDRRRALVDALYRSDGLRLAYDAGATRTAAEAFDERAGNCLSLVLMTASFARHLGLQVQFQRVQVDDEYSRAGGLSMAAGHVNIVVGRGPGIDRGESHWLTIDFLPQADLRNQRSQPVDESTVVAMFLNNRAAEALAAGQVDDAYWWARAAVRHDARFLAGANTLGVVYLRAKRPREAEQALRYVLGHDPDSVPALANLAQLLAAEGRAGEAAPFAARLARLQPDPPFWHLDRAREALARGDAAGALERLQHELRRQPHQHEVHFELARAHLALGHAAEAVRHLALARDYSPGAGTQALYAGKLERLRSLGVH